MEPSRQKELINKIFALWLYREMDGNFSLDDDNNLMGEIPEQTKFISEKLKSFGITIEIPIEALIFINLVTDTNPGFSLILARKLIKASKTKDKVSAFAVLEIFPQILEGDTPFVKETKYYHMFYNWWLSQKEGDINLVDTEEYWKNL